MKKLLITLVLAIAGLGTCMAQKVSTLKWIPLTTDMATTMWKNMVIDENGDIDEMHFLTLEEWGWYRNGQFTNPQDATQLMQVWMVYPDELWQDRVDDGNVAYKSKIKDGKLMLSERRNRTTGAVDRKATGTVTLVGMTTDRHLLTVDNQGVYRVFKY